MSPKSSCELCHNLTEATSLPVNHTPIIHTTVEGLKTSRDKGCAFCDLLWDIIKSQKIPNEDVHFSLEKLSTDDLSLFIYWGQRYYDPQITLALYVQNGNESDPMRKVFGTKNHIIQNPCSDEATALIKRWLESCQDPAQHGFCVQKNKAVHLPTRVVDVGPSDGSQLPKIIESQGKPGAYVALSHCWGKKQIITTTHATFKDRQKGIQWSDLSKTFQDAISLTRRLGIPYIWIDSLCIIQDDREDWEIEAAKMGDVYENAYVTLAGTASPDGATGFNIPRPPPQSFQLRGTKHNIFAAVQPSHDSFTRRRQADPREMPLLSRAWVYQERILSTRVVHFGFHELVFECKQGYVCECGGIVRYRSLWSQLDSFKTEFSDFLDGRKPDSQSISVWEAMIRGYTACALTFDQDRLPALSATVKRLGPKMGEYLAGLWSFMLPAALFWSANAYDFENPAGPMLNAEAPWKPARRADSKFPPPTWSWASVEGAVIEATYVTAPVQEQVFHIKVISKGTSPLHRDPYGAVKDGRIQVSGPVVPVNCKVVPGNPKTIQHAYFQLEKGGVTHNLLQDVEIAEQDKKTIGSGLFCLIGEHYQDVTDYVGGKPRKTRHNREVTLVLRAKDLSSGLYERVGVTREIPRQWIDAAKETVLTLV